MLLETRLIDLGLKATGETRLPPTKWGDSIGVIRRFSGRGACCGGPLSVRVGSDDTELALRDFRWPRAWIWVMLTLLPLLVGRSAVVRAVGGDGVCPARYLRGERSGLWLFLGEAGGVFGGSTFVLSSLSVPK